MQSNPLSAVSLSAAFCGLESASCCLLYVGSCRFAFHSPSHFITQMSNRGLIRALSKRKRISNDTAATGRPAKQTDNNNASKHAEETKGGEEKQCAEEEHSITRKICNIQDTEDTQACTCTSSHLSDKISNLANMFCTIGFNPCPACLQHSEFCSFHQGVRRAHRHTSIHRWMSLLFAPNNVPYRFSRVWFLLFIQVLAGFCHFTYAIATNNGSYAQSVTFPIHFYSHTNFLYEYSNRSIPYFIWSGSFWWMREHGPWGGWRRHQHAHLGNDHHNWINIFRTNGNQLT
jgi:hypothetical protein